MTSTSSVTKDLKLHERILLAVLYAVVVAVSLLPFRVLYIISDLLYLIVCYAVGYRRKVIRKNLPPHGVQRHGAYQPRRG